MFPDNVLNKKTLMLMNTLKLTNIYINIPYRIDNNKQSILSIISLILMVIFEELFVKFMKFIFSNIIETLVKQ